MHDYHSQASRTYVLICGIFFILCYGANGQTVTCNSTESATSNVFETYDVTVSGISSNYTLNYEPAQYGPGMRLPLGTTEVTATAVMSSSPSTQIGNCTFNVTVNLDELPIVCPPQTELTVGTDPGQPFYTYPDPPFNITYPPESMTYMPYGSITMVRQYGSGSSSNNPRLDTSSRHLVTIVISDGPLQKSCNEATVTVEDREPPTIVCPDDIFQTQTKVGVNALSLKNLTDNSGGHESTAIEPFILPGGDFPVGTTTYTFTAFDAANNNASCSFNVTVELAPTPTPPSTEAMNSTPAQTTPSIPFLTSTSTPVTTPTFTSASSSTAMPVTTSPSTPVASTNSNSITNMISHLSTTANASPTTTSISTLVMTTTSSETSPTSSSLTMVAEPTTMPQSTAESTSRMGATAGPQGASDNLPIIIGCSVAGAVLLIIIIFLAICCSSPGRRAIFGIGPKEPVRIRHVGASRHGVATDPVLLNDRLERTKSNIYASTEIDGDVDMAEDPEMMETGGATGGYKDPAEMNGMHVNDAYEPDDGMMMAKSVL